MEIDWSKGVGPNLNQSSALLVLPAVFLFKLLMTDKPSCLILSSVAQSKMDVVRAVA